MQPSDDADWTAGGDGDDDGELPAEPGLETEAEVTCPHCGVTVTIALDAAGGRAQEYVEDCEVCCRPWQVRVWYDAAGSAKVGLLPLD
jgi:hypothetical protein